MSVATRETDFLVIGSGAGGLSAAVTAAHQGLRVLVAEKEVQYGGTTAWSGGWMWIPRNPLAVAAGLVEDVGVPRHYLQQELGAQFDAARVDAFLEHGPAMVEFFRTHTALQFIDGNGVPDFHGHTAGAALGGRSVCAAPFDGRRLGALRATLKAPLPETTLWGLGIASGAELRHFLNVRRKPASAWYVAQRLAALARDHLLHGRSERLVNGNALVAALAASAQDQGVQLCMQHTATGLLTQTLPDGGTRVVGAVLDTPAGAVQVRARCGVLLACGGFPHDRQRLQALLPHAPSGAEHWSAAARGNTGDGLRLGEAVGAQVATDLVQAAALAPVSLLARRDGSVAHFPHLIERAKPGLIAVTANGHRFVNEADSYHDFMQGLLRATPAGAPVQAWLVCDARFMRRYGLGAAKPFPMPLRPLLRQGYLQRGATLTALSQRCGIDTAGLKASVARYNTMAIAGVDDDFAKGQTPYNRVQGDAETAAAWGSANPCMAPLTQAPFYAVRVVPGSLGTFAGLRANAHGQVLNVQGEPIAGLYAAGNDMNSLMGGNYPSGGITLGPAMTFGFIAARHAAAQA